MLLNRMQKQSACLHLAFGILAAAALLPAQTATQAVTGTVTKVDAAARSLTLKTDSAQEFTVTLEPKATVRRIAAGETDLTKATVIQPADVSPGDRLQARGKVDNGTVAATQLWVMSSGDVAKKQQADQADWDKRGITGLVTATSGDSVTIGVKNLNGATRQIVVTAAPNTIVRRYAPDSIKFADAKPSRISEVKVGDQLRARGDRNADGSEMKAEEIVSGTFKTVAGVILSVDPKEMLVQVRDLETKKPLTVKVNADSTMKKFDPQAAQLIAARLHQTDSGGAGGRGARAGGQGGRGGGSADLQQLLDRSPSIALADLKNGDALVISSTVGANADKVTAISLVAGVEPILTKPGTQEMSLGSWNLVGGIE
jgi:ribosomal protein L21E